MHARSSGCDHNVPERVSDFQIELPGILSYTGPLDNHKFPFVCMKKCSKWLKVVLKVDSKTNLTLRLNIGIHKMLKICSWCRVTVPMYNEIPADFPPATLNCTY